MGEGMGGVQWARAIAAMVRPVLHTRARRPVSGTAGSPPTPCHEERALTQTLTVCVRVCVCLLQFITYIVVEIEKV